jgi:hypothetical protein
MMRLDANGWPEGNTPQSQARDHMGDAQGRPAAYS